MYMDCAFLWFETANFTHILQGYFTGSWAITILSVKQSLMNMPFCGDLYETPLEWGYWWVIHDDLIKWKHFRHNWPFVRGIHHSPVYSPHKGQWRGALIFSFICFGMNDWVNNREAGDLRCYRAHYDVIVMLSQVKLGDRITYLCQIIINYLYITLCWDGLISKLVCIVLCKR